MIALIAIVMMDLLAACTAVPPQRDREASRSRNTEAWVQSRLPVRASDETAAYLRDVGDRLAAAAPPSSYPWEIRGLQSRSVRAFAIGGGRVYVGDGAILAAGDESELAAILAHEMGHQVAGHFRVRDERPGFWGTLLSAVGGDSEPEASDPVLAFDADPRAEMEADEVGVQILEAAGYDPFAALRVAERVLSRDDHPDDRAGSARIENLRRVLGDRKPVGDRDSEGFRHVKQMLE